MQRGATLAAHGQVAHVQPPIDHVLPAVARLDQIQSVAPTLLCVRCMWLDAQTQVTAASVTAEYMAVYCSSF